ncbi:helix-turn-helix domain-containing protein [Paenibacillus thiaminolyticus]|uniref:MerR family transcriptional regulator n=1 Tax=Paenibacillus thiaminolyticus TaxID=49283 RepID=UPI003D28DE88
MFKISEFSKISQVSVKTLRYYDQLNLLKPAHIDKFTGYRYYSADQMFQLHRILAYKELGLSLDQIRQMMCEHIPLEQIRGMFRLKQLNPLWRRSKPNLPASKSVCVPSRMRGRGCRRMKSF